MREIQDLLSRVTPADYEKITSILMTHICNRRQPKLRAEDRVEVEIEEIINQYGSWGEKINVREAILEYGANSGFYQVDGNSIVLTELGRRECQKIDIAPE